MGEDGGLRRHERTGGHWGGLGTSGVTTRGKQPEGMETTGSGGDHNRKWWRPQPEVREATTGSGAGSNRKQRGRHLTPTTALSAAPTAAAAASPSPIGASPGFAAAAVTAATSVSPPPQSCPRASSACTRRAASLMSLRTTVRCCVRPLTLRTRRVRSRFTPGLNSQSRS